MSAWLVCGVSGTRLGEKERRVLELLAPGGLVLFARNVESAGQLRELVRELRGLPSRPYVAVDLEGGRVNRLARLLGPLPGATQAAAAGPAAVEALGEAAGAACAHLGIGVDYAPVLDVGREGGWLGLEGRCFGVTSAQVAAAGERFLGGLERYGVAGCLKHYPGLGSGAVDSHHELPVLGDEVAGEEAVFAELTRATRAVMVAHALAPALGEGVLPASLSATVVARLKARDGGPLIADDLEMGALERYGSLGERAAAALLAGCDQVLVCNALEEREGVIAHIDAWVERDVLLAAAVARSRRRSAGFGTGPLAEVTWEQVEAAVARARSFAGAPG